MEEANTCITNDEYLDISNSNLLDSIDFDDLFMDIDNGDELPDLEMDPDLLAEFSISGGEESSTTSAENVVSPDSFFDGNLCYVLEGLENGNPNNNIDNVVISEDLDVQTNYDNDDGLMRINQLEDVEIQSKRKGYDFEPVMLINPSPFDENNKVHKTASYHGLSKTRCNKSIDNHGKRKNKVEWTAELHKRFVQAVEQLGVDKAVPSRILELMGIHCLTRHNIASHLQIYRSHRKHSLAREVEAVNWTQKRQMYGVAMGGAKHGAVTMSWPPPTLGFTPMLTNMHHPLRPLHVWGHPTMDTQARRTVWPKQVVLPMARAPLTWTPHHPHIDAFWHPSHHHRLPLPPVLPGIPPHAMYRPEHRVPPPRTTPFGQNSPTEVTQTKESVDASLGDVLAKPWLPLPIGLKPPSMDTVLVELQHRGFPKIPPSCG